MQFRDLAPEVQELAIQKMKEQNKLQRLVNGREAVGALFTWDTPTFWDGIDKGKDMTNHPNYPHHLKTYSIF